MVDRDLVLKKLGFIETRVAELRTQARLDTIGEPRTNAELFELLHRAQWIGPELTRSMRNLAGFRNVVVHGYEDVALGIVKDIVRNRLGDLIEFAAAIREKLQGR